MKWEVCIVLGLVLLFNSCGCRDYTIASAKNPIISHHSGNRLLELCKNSEIIISIPVLEKDFTREYRLPNDSIIIGPTAGVSYCYTNVDSFLVVGKGSEFEVGKCKFRVLEVEPRQLYDSVTHDIWGESITLQTIAYPKFCPCQNAQLRKYERRQSSKEEEHEE